MFLDSQFVCMKIGPKRVNVENAPRFGHFGFTLLNYFMILQNNGLECITENLVLLDIILLKPQIGECITEEVQLCLWGRKNYV